MNKKAIIFDLDGTLIDSEMRTFEVKRAICQKYQFPLDEEFFVTTAGMSFGIFLEKVAPFLTFEEREKIREEMRIKAFKNLDYTSILFPHAKETLTGLKNLGYKIVLATNSHLWKINDFLDQLSWQNFFDVIVCVNDVSKAKPDPEIYEVCLKKLQMKADDVLVIEDSQVGIMAAKSINIKVVCRKENRFVNKQNGADFYIDDLSEILDLLQK